MNIDDLTVGQLKQIRALLGESVAGSGSSDTSLRVGEKVFIRTVTHYYTGEIEAVTATDIRLKDAAWIADTGRFSEALTKGVLGEVEPYPRGCIVMRAGISDVSPWTHALPREVK